MTDREKIEKLARGMGWRRYEQGFDEDSGTWPDI